MESSKERIFTQDSAIWRVTRENVLLLGGPAAAILQIAHPQVALGVARHSNFRTNALGRLTRTLEAVHTITFGTREEADAVAARVQASHSVVRGHSPQEYSATDSDAQFWVLATLIALSVEVYERAVGRLSITDKRDFLSDMRRFGKWFGLPEDYGPATWAGFQTYYHGMLAEPAMGSLPISRELARHIVYPRRPWVLRPGWPISSLCAREFLPQPLREKLDLAQSPSQRRLARALVSFIRLTLPVLPPQIRLVPKYRLACRGM